MRSPSSAARLATSLGLITALLVSSARVRGAGEFDSRANPLRYSGEYLDPAWGGTYLRARWYQPALPSFVSRDAALRQLNHYGYGGGDPVMHVDPSGRSFRSFQRQLGHVLHAMNEGAFGHLSRLAFGWASGPLQIVANPRGFWRAVEHDSAGMDILLAGGIAAEIASSRLAAPLLGNVPPTFWMQVGGEAALGTTQATLASLGHGLRFSASRFVRGMEYTASPEVVGRVFFGLGYQPFDLREADVNRIVDRWEPTDNQALIIRMQRPRTAGSRPWTSPWQETLMMGRYHETLIALGRYEVHVTLVGAEGIEAESLLAAPGYSFSSVVRQLGGGRGARFSLAGEVRDLDPTQFADNPLDLPVAARRARSQPFRPDSRWSATNYSQWHAHKIRQGLQD